MCGYLHVELSSKIYSMVVAAWEAMREVGFFFRRDRVGPFDAASPSGRLIRKLGSTSFNNCRGKILVDCYCVHG